jgi:aminoglycoside phosphotransferase (APT) family kinase protein
MSANDPRSTRVLAHLGLPRAEMLGRGSEGTVFALDDAQVIKIYGATPREYLEHLAGLLANIARHPLPFATPEIDEIGEVEGICYTRERRLPGKRIEPIFPTLDPQTQRQLLANFISVLPALHEITWEHAPYGQAMTMGGAIHDATWAGYLVKMIRRATERSLPDLEEDLDDASIKIERVIHAITRDLPDPPKRVVHGDYFFANVLFNDDLTLASVLDFSPHTVVGDPMMDVAGAISFLTLDPAITPTHVSDLTTLVAPGYGPEFPSRLAIYTLYYSLYFSDTKAFDPATYTWCINNLRDDMLWEGLLARWL